MAKSISRRLADSASPTGAIDGTLSTAAQTNITSVGTLSALTVSGDLTVDTSTLKVDSTNNRVGIGNSSPTNDLTIGTNLGSGYVISAQTSAAYGLVLQTTESTPSANAALWVRNDDDGTVNTLFRVNNNGNVGIGTISTYNMRTTIAGAGSALTTGTGSYAVASIYDTATAAAGTGGGLAFQGDDGTNSAVTFATVNGSKENATSGNYASYLGFSTRANAGNLTEKLRIDSSGNVGVGTTPRSLLDLGAGSTGATQISWHTDSTTSYGNIWQSLNGARTIIANGLKGSDSVNNGFEASTSSTWGRTAIEQDYGLIKFYTNAATATTYGASYTPSERMRIDSSGKVGIGRVPRVMLDVAGEAAIAYNATYGLRFYNQPQNNWSFIGNDVTTSGSDLRFGDSTGEVMRLSGGKVGIGTTPSHVLHVDDSSTSTLVTIHNTNGSSSDCRGLDVETSTTGTTVQRWFNAGSELGRFTATGNLLVGKTALEYSSNAGVILRNDGLISGVRDGGNVCNFNRLSSDGAIITLHRDGTAIGSITAIPTGVQYNTTSDRRLKENIKTIDNSTEKLMAMNPVTHTWKARPEADAVHGFIAQEMLEIVPEAVYGDPEGEEMMSMDYGRITPVIVAALQDALKEIKELKTRINQLEDK